MLKLGRDNQPLLFQEQKRRPKWMMPYISTGEKSGTSPVWCLYFLLGSFEKVKYAIDKKNKLGKSYWVCFSTPPSKKKMTRNRWRPWTSMGVGGCFQWSWFSCCIQLLDAVDCSLPGSSICGISQARILDWVAISFCRGSSQWS